MSPTSTRPRNHKTASSVSQPTMVRKAGNAKKATSRIKKPSHAPLVDAAVTNADAGADADAEIATLKAQLAEAQRLQREAEGKIASVPLHVANKNENETILAILKPKGEAGSRKSGFNLREAMKLEGVGQKELYDAIQRSIRTNAIKAGLDFSIDYRRQDPEKLANVFKMTRRDHPYMTKKRFPADWSAAEILKQYMKNYRRHAVRKGRMESRAEKKRKEQGEANGQAEFGLHNIDDEGSCDELSDQGNSE